MKRRNDILLPETEVELKVFIGKIIGFLQCYISPFLSRLFFDRLQ